MIASDVIDDQVPMARPRVEAGKVAVMMARLPGTSSAAPRPCTARATMSMSAVDDSAHHKEAAPKIATPAPYKRTRPRRSASEPPASMSDERTSRYASTIHCAWLTSAPSAFCSTGSATLMTVLSMKAIDEPRIVAARTHRPCCCCMPPLYGTAAVPNRENRESTFVARDRHTVI